MTSLADFPVPKAIQKVFHKSMEALGGKNQNSESQGAARWEEYCWGVGVSTSAFDATVDVRR